MLLVLTDTHRYVLSGWVVSTGEGSKDDPISKYILNALHVGERHGLRNLVLGKLHFLNLELFYSDELLVSLMISRNTYSISMST